MRPIRLPKECAACRPLLSPYADHETTLAQTRQVAAHVGGCARCSAELAAIRRMNNGIASLPQHPPDPRIREQLFRAIADYDAVQAPVVAPRRPLPAPRPAQPRAQRALPWLGNLAGAFAVLVALSTGVVLVGLSQLAPIAQDGHPTAIGLFVPTAPPAAISNVPGAQPTGVAGLGAQPTAAVPRTATGTPFWEPPSEDAPDGHAIRDAQWGYSLTYPAGWWSAAAPPAEVEGEGVLGRRQLAPWTRQAAGAHAPYYLTLDVLTLTQAQAAIEQAGYRELVEAGGLRGVQGRREAEGARLHEIYLLDDPHAYRLRLVVGNDDPAEFAAHWTAGMAGSTAILASFRPATDLAQHPAGYAPLLAVRGGNLWAVDADGSHARQLTQSGDVQAFSLAPNLAQVAVATKGGVIALVSSDGVGAVQVVGTMNRVLDVAWNGAHSLVGLAEEKSGNGLSLYAIAASVNGPLQPITSLRDVPDGGLGAHRLQVAPDRTWIAFLAGSGSADGQRLYGVRPDGARLGPLSEGDVREFTWLPPTVGGAAGEAALALLTRSGGGEATLITPMRLTFGAPGTPATRLALDSTVTPGQQAQGLTTNAAGEIAYAVFAGRTWQDVRTLNALAADPAATRHTSPAAPNSPAPITLTWTADGTHLWLQTARDGLRRLDPASGLSTLILGDTDP